MKENKDGGPAFPGAWMPPEADRPPIGMSLRDHFAGLALGVVATSMMSVVHHRMQTDERTSPYVWDGMSELAYEVADSMLAARERKP